MEEEEEDEVEEEDVSFVSLLLVVHTKKTGALVKMQETKTGFVVLKATCFFFRVPHGISLTDSPGCASQADVSSGEGGGSGNGSREHFSNCFNVENVGKLDELRREGGKKKTVSSSTFSFASQVSCDRRQWNCFDCPLGEPKRAFIPPPPPPPPPPAVIRTPHPAAAYASYLRRRTQTKEKCASKHQSGSCCCVYYSGTLICVCYYSSFLKKRLCFGAQSRLFSRQYFLFFLPQLW